MRVFLIVVTAVILAAQGDPAVDAYRAWEATQGGVGYQTRMQHLLEVSAEWVSKWPDNLFAWQQRRLALVSTQSRSAELWKQVDENIVRLSPPHTFAGAAAYDWVTAGVNVEAAEKLLLDEIASADAQPKPVRSEKDTLADLVDEAWFTGRPFGMLCSLARAQIRLKKYEQAQATIDRIHGWLEGDFRKYFDTDPLEAFPDYDAKYFQLSAELAVAEGRKADALAFYHGYLANPYYLRVYNSPVALTPLPSVWKAIGGTDAGWAAFSAVPPLPPGVPAGRMGVQYMPWVKVDYKLPPMQVADLEGRKWTNQDFQGKVTIVYLWASFCAPCWPTLSALQMSAERLERRSDVQLVTLSVDEEREKLVAFMQQKHYTFPVLSSKTYVEKVLPQFTLGQLWLMDGSGSVRLQRTMNNFLGAEDALVQELLYKAGLLGK